MDPAAQLLLNPQNPIKLFEAQQKNMPSMPAPKKFEIKSKHAQALLEKYQSSLPTFQQIPGKESGASKTLNDEYKQVCSSDKQLIRLFKDGTKDVIKKREVEKKKEELIQAQAQQKKAAAISDRKKELSKQNADNANGQNDGDKGKSAKNQGDKNEERKQRRRGRAVTQTDTIEDQNRPNSANPRMEGKGKVKHSKSITEKDAEKLRDSKLNKLQIQQNFDKQ